MSSLLGRDKVIFEVADERARQEVLWGRQDHPNGTGHQEWTFRAEDRKEHNAQLVHTNSMNWLAILAEEVYEAFAETDPSKLRNELVQCAAVCVNWIESIDRREAGARSTASAGDAGGPSTHAGADQRAT